jgi:hypothetical protein
LAPGSAVDAAPDEGRQLIAWGVAAECRRTPSSEGSEFASFAPGGAEV